MNPELEQFLQDNPGLFKKLMISQLLGSQELMAHSYQTILKAFEEHVALMEHPFHQELPPDYAIGDIAIGLYTLSPEILIKLFLEKQSGHIVNAAATGAGKTVSTLIILDQIQKLYPTTPIRYLVFASKIRCEQRNLIVNNQPGTAYYLDKTSLAIHPFTHIQNVEPKIVYSDLARVTATETGLMAGGQLYLQKNIFDYTSKNPDANFIEFVQWLSRKKESSYDYKGYRDRLVIRLESILLEIEEIFNCYRGIEDHVYVEENLVVEIPCSSSFIMSLVSGIVLLRMFRFKAANPEYLRYKNIIVLEDIQLGLRDG
ncbi:hypothetical protein BVY01_03425 [bacterium I07]|nr:hypothetical protein BVY01_03425 [bacterium I07]